MGDPLAITIDPTQITDVQIDLPLWVNVMQFRGNMPECLTEVRTRLDIDSDAITQSSSGKIQDIAHQLRGAPAAGEDVLGNGATFFVLQTLRQQFRPGSDGKQRVAQIMAEHGDKLFT
ncbi:hypothetical protein D3C79_646190 [compost metagenome]